MLFFPYCRSDLITVTGDKWIGLSWAFTSPVDGRQGSLPSWEKQQQKAAGALQGQPQGNESLFPLQMQSFPLCLLLCQTLFRLSQSGLHICVGRLGACFGPRDEGGKDLTSLQPTPKHMWMLWERKGESASFAGAARSSLQLSQQRQLCEKKP